MSINPPINMTVTTAPTRQMIGLLSDQSLTQLVNDALRNYQSTLALSRSALANSSLVIPVLVKDEPSATAEERGHGLRLVLQWAVNRLAPGVPLYPLGSYRPLDDPTWRDPCWWHYNLLRHRYLEPLHPDDFVEGGRYTESLLALTGISSPDAFFDERNRAIRAVAERLRQQLLDGQGNEELQRLALQEALRPLEKQVEATKLLGITTTFDEIFPRSLLLEMAAQEQLHKPLIALDALVTQRFLLAGDEGESLWLAPVLRAYVYERQPSEERQHRHRLAAAHYEAEGAALPAARHWQQANLPEKAVRVILPVVDDLIHELQVKELIDLLQRLEAKRLAPGQWYAVQLLLSDLFQRIGQPEDALAACRQALKIAEDGPSQARIYRRMGKLYEKRNRLHALGYYQQAVERFDPDDLELMILLKDRGWLYLLRQQWREAESDLTAALALATSDADELRADIFDALASLYRRQQQYEAALRQARSALAIREKLGYLPRIADSFNNLGIIYRALGEYWHALNAYEEALLTYRKLGNQEATAGALMNIGAAYYLLGQHESALINYKQGLEICQTHSLPYAEVTVCYNLAEALAGLGHRQEALAYWQQGYVLSQRAGFTDEITAFLQLRETTPALATTTSGASHATPPQLTQDNVLVDPALSPEEVETLAMARRHGRISAKQLVDETYISRATATRRLTRLVELGHLVKQGEGRGTYYCLPTQARSQPVDANLAAIRRSLQQCKADLQQQHTISALGITAPPVSLPLVKLTVRFEQTPDLAHYLQLKRQLTDFLQMEVDLLVEDHSILPIETSTTWLWA